VSHIGNWETTEEASSTHLEVPGADGAIVHIDKDKEGVPCVGQEDDMANS
jgi:hypothetical protein